ILFFHWDYLNESIPERRRGQIGWLMSRVDDPAKLATVSKQIDATFDADDPQTTSMSERAMNVGFLGMISTLLSALNIVSAIILAVLALIIGNTIAMGVRERAQEFGVFRAMGFLPRHLRRLVLTEALMI